MFIHLIIARINPWTTIRKYQTHRHCPFIIKGLNCNKRVRPAVRHRKAIVCITNKTSNRGDDEPRESKYFEVFTMIVHLYIMQPYDAIFKSLCFSINCRLRSVSNYLCSKNKIKSSFVSFLALTLGDYACSSK